jgi:hypothetical protein
MRRRLDIRSKTCIAQSVFEGFIGAWNDEKWLLNEFAIVVGSVVFTLLTTNSLHVKEQPDDEFFVFTNFFQKDQYFFGDLKKLEFLSKKKFIIFVLIRRP